MRGSFLLVTALVAGCNPLFGLEPVTLDSGAAPDASAIDASASDAVDDDGGTTPDANLCGNGVIDGGEACDDGNQNETDGCTTRCMLEFSSAGCADGVREGFADEANHPNIAACGGAWTTPGLPLVRSGTAGCGDDGIHGDGVGCNALDLCAETWHLCGDRFEVLAALGTRPCTDAMGFFASAQRGTTKACNSVGSLIYGCGSAGTIGTTFCAPFTRHSGDACQPLNGWSCTAGAEADTVTHQGGSGGVLCCR